MSRIRTTYENALAVTKSDSTPLSPACSALYIGGAGDVAIIPKGGQTAVTLKAVPVGTTLQVSATYVMSTNTTATNIVALW